MRYKVGDEIMILAKLEVEYFVVGKIGVITKIEKSKECGHTFETRFEDMKNILNCVVRGEGYFKKTNEITEQDMADIVAYKLTRK